MLAWDVAFNIRPPHWPGPGDAESPSLFVSNVPLDPFVAEGGDEGAPVVRAHPESPSGAAIREAAGRLVELVPPAADETCTARIALLMEQLDQGAPSRS
jgi:hypothetical protein